jgi:hypothetical protein
MRTRWVHRPDSGVHVAERLRTPPYSRSEVLLSSCKVPLKSCLYRRPFDDTRPVGAASEGHSQAPALSQIRRRWLEVMSRICLSEEAGMPPPEVRIRVLAKSSFVSMATVLDVCAIYCVDNLLRCRAIAEAVWRAASLSGVLWWLTPQG